MRGYTATSLRPSHIEEPKRITDSGQAAETARSLIGDQMDIKEHFILITLDGASHITRAETVHVGTLNQSLVHPRDVFRPAIIDNSAGIIVLHNHPSGTLEASRSDINITNRLVQTGKTIGIELLDSIIVTENGHLSLQEEGLL